MDAPGLFLSLAEECKIRLEEEIYFCSVFFSHNYLTATSAQNNHNLRNFKILIGKHIKKN